MQHTRQARQLAMTLAAALAILGGHARAADAIPGSMPGATLESLLAAARASNPEYGAMRAEASAAGERAAAAGALPDPRLKVELQDLTMGNEQNPSLSPSRVGSTRYQVMQDLPWFGKRDLQRAVAEREADATRGRAAGTWFDISARIKVAYAQSYYLAQNEKLALEITDLMARLEKVAQARYASGLAPQQDVIRAQVELTSLDNELIALAGERRGNRVRINALLARPANAPLAAPERMAPLPALASGQLDYAALEQKVRARNPLLFADDAKLRAAEQSRDLTLKNRYPDFTVGVAPVQSGRSVKNWELMVEFNIPLQQGTRRAQEREAEATVTAARLRKDATANQLLADLAESLSGLEAARSTEHSVTSSLVPQAELTFNAALAGYENGKVDFGALLDAQRQIRAARQSLLRAQVEAIARAVQIEQLAGEE